MNDMVQSEVLGIVRGIMNCRKAGIRDASGTKRILTVSRRSFGSIWGFPNLSPPAIAGAFGKKTIVLPIRWTAAVGGRSGLPKVPSGNENSTRTRGFPRGREKAGQHGKGHAALQDTSPYGYAGFAPPSPNLSGVASGPYFSAGENKERERVEENCRP